MAITPPARLDFDVPLVTCDFDPHDANTLVVGGGGEKKAIAALDVSRRDAVHVVARLDLPRTEDYPTKIAVGPRKGKAALVLAGINSSKADMEKGLNEHLRVFAVRPRPESEGATAAAAAAAVSELVRAALFSSAEKNVFQSLLRLSPQLVDGPHRQVGAVATGFGKQPEIVVFDLVPAGPAVVKAKDRLVLPKEAVDMDILQVGDDQWQLAYCDTHDVYLVDIGTSKVGPPRRVYSSPDDDASGKSLRPSFKALRYLTSAFVLATLNLPRSSGVLLNGLRLPKAEQAKARLAVSQRLPRSIPRAIGMEVRNLAPPSSSSARQGDTEFVVAVNGFPDSIAIYTLQHQLTAGIDLIVNLHAVTTLKAVQAPNFISDMAISYFQPPKTSTAARPCSLKVASVSMEPPAVLVHTLPLRKYRHGDGPVRKGRPPRTPRYVLALKSKPPSMVGLVLFIAAVVLALAVVLQGSLEIWGLSDPVLGARHVTPTSWHRPRQVPRPRPRPGQFLGGHLSTLKPGERPLLRVGAAAGGGEAVQVVAHDREQHGGGGREWDAMHPAERQAWKEKLVEAGHWAEGMGETVFKGILFGELAGAVGNMVGG